MVAALCAVIMLLGQVLGIGMYVSPMLCGILLGVIVAIIVTFAFKKTKVYHKLLP